MGNPTPDDRTRDALFDGRLVLSQPRDGYRFSVEAPLLVWFAVSRQDRPVRNCVDLGAGCGVIGLGLLAAGGAQTVLAVEVQPPLATLARDNATANGFEPSRYRVVSASCSELGETPPPASADLVVSNPPYWPAGSGRPPGDEQRRIACHETELDIASWVSVAARLLEPRRGRVCFVFPARRLDSLLAAIQAAGLAATRLRLVHPRPRQDAELTLLEARPGGDGKLRVEPPLVLRNDRGEDTAEADAILSGEFSEDLRSLPDRRRARA